MTALAPGTAATAPRTAAIPTVASIAAPRWRWCLPAAVAGGDIAAAALALAAAAWFGDSPRGGDLTVADSTVDYALAAVAVLVSWPLLLAAQGAYDRDVAGAGPAELGRVLRAGLGLFALIAACHLVLDTDLTGAGAIVTVVAVTAATAGVRLAAERIVRRARRDHRLVQRAVVYGPPAEAAALAGRLDHEPSHRIEVVASCPSDPAGNGSGEDAVLDVMASTGADVLAVAGETSPARLRALAWALDGTGADLLVAPAAAEGADPLGVQPVPGMPLLRVDRCRLTRGRLLVKAALDRVGAALLVVLLSPLLAAAALAVRLSGPGPVVYRQVRAGRDGQQFELLKFRTMVADAEARLDGLRHRNAADGLLFKIPSDPRITRVGRILRRTSLDELPQLWNVVRGDMSLVGPRPLPVSPDALVGDARRRLRVKPGITGLWQVSGRSDLGWAETVRLDARYVDQWSLGLDARILLRTPLAVARGRGAY